MRIRALLFLSVAAVAVLGVGASGASAATIFTSAAHTTRVANGATATAVSTGVRLTSGTATVNNCTSSSLNLSLTANAHPSQITVTGGSFSGCALATTFTGSWTIHLLEHLGTIPLGTVYRAKVTNVRVDFLGGTYTGNFETGEGGTVTATQNATTGTGICLSLLQGGTLSGPLTTVGKVDGTYCLSGTAANWSLT